MISSNYEYIQKFSYPYKNFGDHTKGEIEIVRDPTVIRQILDRLQDSAAAANHSPGKLGVVYEDKYILVVVDPVIFPNGKTGTYLRIIERGALDGAAGAVLLPVSDGKIYLRHIFRHATRSWELELPRGFRDPEKDLQHTVKTELAEELGLQAEKIITIGSINSNTGLLAGTAEAFLVQCKPGEPKPAPEEGEAFGDMVILSPQELWEKIRRGEIRDGFTLSALQLAQVHGHLKFT